MPSSPLATPLSRRTFLRLGIRGAILALVAALTGAFALRYSKRRQFPAEIVKRKLSYLTLPAEPELAKFSAQYLESVGPKRTALILELASLGILYSFLGWLRIPNKPAKLLPEIEEHVCFIFLMSTNFFQQGAKEQLPLSYSVLYNPHRYPCQNPFARY
jgi:hypothetical protein